MREQIISWGIDILGPIVAIGIGWLVTQAGLWLATKTKNEKLKQLIENAAANAASGVRLVESDLRPLAKQGINNKLTPEEQVRLRDEAVARLRASLGAAMLAQIKAVQGLTETELKAWLESRVADAHARGVVRKTHP